jgi:hypothetical protein
MFIEYDQQIVTQYRKSNTGTTLYSVDVQTINAYFLFSSNQTSRTVDNADDIKMNKELLIKLCCPLGFLWTLEVSILTRTNVDSVRPVPRNQWTLPLTRPSMPPSSLKGENVIDSFHTASVSKTHYFQICVIIIPIN